MPDKSNDYRFVTRWVVESTCEEVSHVLGNPLDLPRWWPMVYLEVLELRPPNASGTGRRVRLVTKGQLPYKLRWEFEVVESRYPYGLLWALMPPRREQVECGPALDQRERQLNAIRESSD